MSYDLINMCLSLDSSKRSLKCVLNHNGNEYSSVPIGDSVLTKERYKNIKWLLSLITYDDNGGSFVRISCLNEKVITLTIHVFSAYDTTVTKRGTEHEKHDQREKLMEKFSGENIINQPLVLAFTGVVKISLVTEKQQTTRK